LRRPVGAGEVGGRAPAPKASGWAPAPKGSGWSRTVGGVVVGPAGRARAAAVEVRRRVRRWVRRAIFFWVSLGFGEDSFGGVERCDSGRWVLVWVLLDGVVVWPDFFCGCEETRRAIDCFILGERVEAWRRGILLTLNLSRML
jgi:hypothetical protein